MRTNADALIRPTNESPVDIADIADLDAALPSASSLMDGMADGIHVEDRDACITTANPAFARLYGLDDRGQATGHTLAAVYRAAWEGRGEEPPDETIVALAASSRMTPLDLRLPDDRWVRVRGGASGHHTAVVLHVDVTDLHRRLAAAERAAEAAGVRDPRRGDGMECFEAALERMDQGIMMINGDRVVEVCNRRAMELLDLPASLMETKPTFDEVLGYQWGLEEFAHTPRDLLDFVEAGGILDRPHCYDRKRPNGQVVEIHSVPIAGGGVLRTYTDITERKRLDEKIRHIARHDGLTSLANRDTFLEHLEAAVRASTETGAVFAVHYLDLDGFKPINDRHGHVMGDKVLTEAARRMRAIARDTDIVARMGGDEFAILQFGVASDDEARRLAERVVDGVREPIRIDAERLQVSASIGIAVCRDGRSDADRLIRDADRAMYAAKAQGNGCVRVFAEDASR